MSLPMRKTFIAAFALMAIACTSEQKMPEGAAEPHAPRSAVAAPAAAAAAMDAGATEEVKDSQVLSKAKRCPKRSKLVNGKCMLQVEE